MVRVQFLDRGSLGSPARFPSRTSLLLGIIYLSFQAFPIVFENGHGFNAQTTGLTFLGIALGMFIGVSTQPYWNRYVSITLNFFFFQSVDAYSIGLCNRQSRRYREAHGNYPPEEILRIGQVGGILAPIGRFPAFS